jgi:hypothetical protein
MAASLLERIPLDEITVQARQARPGRAALTVIAAVLFGLGWVACRALAGAWFVIAWCGAAVAEGWQSARRAGASS